MAIGDDGFIFDVLFFFGVVLTVLIANDECFPVFMLAGELWLLSFLS